MIVARAIRPWIVGGLAAATLASSIAGLVALMGGGAVALGPVRLLTLAPGLDIAADSLVSRPGMTRAKADRAERLSRAAIAEWPYDTRAWLRLAWLQSAGNTPAAQGAIASLRRSYDLVPVDRDWGPLRVRLSLERWQALDPDLRSRVEAEVRLLWRMPTPQQALRDEAPSIMNGEGRLALLLWFVKLSDEERQMTKLPAPGGTGPHLPAN